MKLSVGFWCKLKIGVDQFAKHIIFFQLLVEPPLFPFSSFKQINEWAFIN